jgi:hypothetical protein
MNRCAVFLLALLPAAQGCSSSYQPARSPRITTVVDSSVPVFVKDGKRYGTATFGGGLVHAVQGNPRAEEEARVGRNLVIGGLVFDIMGLTSETAGLILLTPNDHANRNTATGLLLGGLLGVTVGSVLLLSAPPHIYDAVNIYNDGIDAPR